MTSVSNYQNGSRVNAAKMIAAQFGVGEQTVYRDAKFANAVTRVAKVCGYEAQRTILAGKTKWTHKYTLAVLDAESDEQVRSLYEAAAAGKRYSPLQHVAASSTCEHGKPDGHFRRGGMDGKVYRVSRQARAAGAIKAQATKAAKQAAEPYDPRLLFNVLDRLDREIAAVKGNHAEWQSEASKDSVVSCLATARDRVRAVLGAFYEMDG